MPAGKGSIRVDRAGERSTVVWDRPPVHVFDIALLENLATALRSEPVRSAHVVVLRGANHRWSAGFEVADHLAGQIRRMFEAFRSLLEAIREIPCPTLAAVEGPCLGGGLELLSVCDLAVAASTATFGQPEIRLGVFPPLAAATYGRTLGSKRAAELLFLGETLSARQAQEFGLVSRVVADERVDEEVDRVSEHLGGLRREALVLLKQVMREEEPQPWAGLEGAERAYLERLMTLPHAEEGLRAFLEKRAPAWRSVAP